MTPEEIRLACLKLARPDVTQNPDAELILARAKAFEVYVTSKSPAMPAQSGDRGKASKT